MVKYCKYGHDSKVSALFLQSSASWTSACAELLLSTKQSILGFLRHLLNRLINFLDNYLIIATAILTNKFMTACLSHFFNCSTLISKKSRIECRYISIVILITRRIELSFQPSNARDKLAILKILKKLSESIIVHFFFLF